MNTRTQSKRSFLSIIGLLVALSFGVVMTQNALAATITVNTTSMTVANDGVCSLIEAITAANTDTASGAAAGECAAGSGADIINLATTTYTLTAIGSVADGNNGLPDVTTQITINGGGATITRSGSTSFRILHVAATGNLTLNSLTISNGRATGSGSAKYGAGIYNLGTLALSSVTISNNQGAGSSAKGAGIFNASGANLTVSGSTFSGNNHTGLTSNGGGLHNEGTANVSSSAFSSNTATGSGGGVYRGAGTLTLTNTTLTSNTPGNCGGTITDGGGNNSNDATCGFAGPTPTIDINNVTVAENGGSGSFDVTLSVASGSTVTVNYTFNNGSAVNGTDFNGTNGTATFIAGDTSEPVNFTLTDDGLFEGTENFTVTLSGAVNGNIGTGTGTATINDDEAASTLNINSVTVGEGDGSGNFTVTLSPASAGTVTVNYAFSNGSAANGTDFGGTDSSLTFISGETSKNIPFSITQDAIIEGNEDFSVTLSGASGASVGTGTGTATITDDESGATFNINSVTVNEGDGSGMLQVTLSTAMPGTVTVDFAFGDVSATNGADYGGTNGTLTFVAGDTSEDIPFTLTDDVLGEGVETFNVNLSNATGGASVGTGTGTVTINDNEAVMGFSVDDPVANETDAGGTFTVTLSPAAGGTVTVDYAITDDNATNGVDYAATMTGTLTFNAGVTTQPVPFTLIDDALTEGTERFTITLSNSSGPAIGDATGQTRIIDDEAPATVGGGEPVAPPAFVPPPPPPLPPCDVQDDAPDAPFRINVTNATNAASCRPIIQNGEGEMGAIGSQSVIDNGVQQALDVYGVDISSGLTIIEVCLKGQGGIIFLDSKQMPRQPQWMPTTFKDGFTCTVIPNDGMVVLVVNNGYNGAAPANNSAPQSSIPANATPLTDCRVTTINMVNIRPVPSAEGNEPISVVPYDLTLDATARTADWFQVIYLDFQGWIHADYLTTRGSCG